MGSGILGIGTSALGAFRQSLETIGHNIANVNTEGYSRQRVELGAQPPRYYGGQYVGAGVQVNAVTRAFNQFVTDQFANYTATDAHAQRYAELASQVDNLLAADGSALAPGLQGFFDAVQGVVTDPTAEAGRQVLLSRGEALVGRFHALDQQLDFLRASANSEVGVLVSEINTIAADIASVNQAIAGAAGPGVPNDLLDKRNALVNQLAEKVTVRTVEQDDGALNVMIGSGLALVTGNRANTLTATRADAGGRIDVGLSTPAGAVPVTDQLSGGRLGGVLDFRDRILDPAQNELGRIAIGLASAFNARHTQGYDLNGDPGGAFFTVPQPRAFGAPGNTGTVQPPDVTIADTGQLTAADYQLKLDGGAWTLTRLDTGQAVALTGNGTAADPLLADGLSIEVPTAAADGDRFLIQPTRDAAGAIEVALTDPAAIAAAGESAVPGESNGVGDNSNALALAGLQGAAVLGTETLSDAYAGLVAQVGTRTQAAQTNAETQGALLEQASRRRESISGVNLDEEAAALLQYQQAYQAAAQVITAADRMFQTLLNATGR